MKHLNLSQAQKSKQHNERFSPPTQFDFPKKAKAYPRKIDNEEEDISEEHAGLLAENEEEEEEALYW